MSNRSLTTGNVRAVERAIDILECFLPDKPWMSVLEIQRKVPLSRPTLYRLLQTLIAKGLVRSEGDPQRFALDFGIGRLAHNWIAAIDVIALARPILEELRTVTGETAALFVRRGNLRQCVAEVVSPHVLAISRRDSVRLITCGAVRAVRRSWPFSTATRMTPLLGLCRRPSISPPSRRTYRACGGTDFSLAEAKFLSALLLSRLRTSTTQAVLSVRLVYSVQMRGLMSNGRLRPPLRSSTPPQRYQPPLDMPHRGIRTL